MANQFKVAILALTVTLSGCAWYAIDATSETYVCSIDQLNVNDVALYTNVECQIDDTGDTSGGDT